MMLKKYVCDHMQLSIYLVRLYCTPINASPLLYYIALFDLIIGDIGDIGITLLPYPWEYLTAYLLHLISTITCVTGLI